MTKFYLSGYEPLTRELLIFMVVRRDMREVDALAAALGLDAIFIASWGVLEDKYYPTTKAIGAGIRFCI